MNVFSGPRLGVAHKRALYRSRRLKDLLTRPELRNYIASLLALAGDQDREERLELLQTSPLFRCFYQELLAVLQAVPDTGGDTGAGRGVGGSTAEKKAFQAGNAADRSPRASMGRPLSPPENARAVPAAQAFGSEGRGDQRAKGPANPAAGIPGPEASDEAAETRGGPPAATGPADPSNPAAQAGDETHQPAAKSPTQPREVTRRITACEGLCTGRVGLYW